MSGSIEGQLPPRGRVPGAEHDNKTGRTGSLPAKQAGQTQGWQPDYSDKAGLRSSWEKSLQARLQINEVHGQTQAWLWQSWRLVLCDISWAGNKRLKEQKCSLASSSFSPTEWFHKEENVWVTDNDRFICLNEISSVHLSPVWGIKWWPSGSVPFPEWGTMF